MTKIIIVGEAYYSDLRPDQGLPPGAPPGIWGGPPLYPDQGLPGWQPRPSHPIAPGGRPYPDQGLPGVPPGFWGGVAPPHPDQGLPAGQIGTPVPPDLMPPPAVPEEIASQYIVSVYNPKTMTWTTKSYPPPAA
jgi:hypothetical protein